MLKLGLTMLIGTLLTGCVTTSDQKLVGNSANIYVGGLAGQKVNGDGTNVSVFNIWTGEDGVQLAQQYCERYGKNLEPNYTFQGITGHYKCGNIDESVIEAIFEKPDVVDAQNALGNCVRTNVPILDDLISDASTISAAVAQSCTSEYKALTKSYIRNLPNSASLGDDYKNAIHSAFEDGRKERALPYVLAWRNLVKRGWDKSRKATENELPNNLFPKGI